MRRIVALLLSLCLCALCGCGEKTRAAILCVKEAVPAAQILCAQSGDLSYGLAASDKAALQQLDNGQCEFVLVTAGGMDGPASARAQRVCGVVLSAFHILSRAGAVEEWTDGTRVVIVGEQDGYGDQMAQQVLACALYGTVRYMKPEEALQALKSKRADVVMGMFAVRSANVERAMEKVKGLTLQGLPESLISIKLPDDSMKKYDLTTGSGRAETYALMGVLASGDAETEKIESIRSAVEQAGWSTGE